MRSRLRSRAQVTLDGHKLLDAGANVSWVDGRLALLLSYSPSPRHPTRKRLSLDVALTAYFKGRLVSTAVCTDGEELRWEALLPDSLSLCRSFKEHLGARSESRPAGWLGGRRGRLGAPGGVQRGPTYPRAHWSWPRRSCLASKQMAATTGPFADWRASLPFAPLGRGVGKTLRVPAKVLGGTQPRSGILARNRHARAPPAQQVGPQFYLSSSTRLLPRASDDARTQMMTDTGPSGKPFRHCGGEMSDSTSFGAKNPFGTRWHHVSRNSFGLMAPNDAETLSCSARSCSSRWSRAFPRCASTCRRSSASTRRSVGCQTR